jgi:hypothetical protein
MKRASLSSRERLLLAINHQEADYVPLTLHTGYAGDFFQNSWVGRSVLKSRGWSSEYELVTEMLEMGTDPMFRFHFRPLQFNPRVEIRTWRGETPAGEELPVWVKEYHTPKGVLRQVVRLTPDWPHYDFYLPFVPLWSDYLVPPARSREYLIKGPEDIEAFACLFIESTKDELTVWAEEAEQVRRFDDERGVLVRSGPHYSLPMLGTGVVDCMGVEKMIEMAVDHPESMHRLLDIFLDWNIKYVSQTLDLRVVDMVVYNGWYDNTQFWSPKMYQTFIAPRLKKLIELVHQGGAKFCLMMPSDYMALLPALVAAGVDVHFGPDPVQDRALDLPRLKREAGERICFWGGVNAWITLGQETPQAIEDEVVRAVQVLGPGGGLILTGIEVLSYLLPWESIEHMIEVWRRVRGYPLGSG